MVFLNCQFNFADLRFLSHSEHDSWWSWWSWWSWCWCFLLSFNCIRTFKHDSFIFFLCVLLKRIRYWYHVTTKSLSVLARMHLEHIKPLRLMIKSPLIYHSKFSIFIRGSKSEKYFTLLMLINDSFWAVFSFSSVNNDRRVAKKLEHPPILTWSF